MESYLEKKSSGLFKNYQRRWFFRQGNKIVYKEKKDSEESKLLSTMDNCTDVRLVSDDVENRSFDIAFKDRTYRLRAVSTSLCVAWVINLKVWTKRMQSDTIPLSTPVWKGLLTAIKYLETFGCGVENLFQHSTATDAVSSFVLNVRVEGDRFFPLESQSFMTLKPEEVASGIKRLLKDLPETILTKALFDRFLAATDEASIKALVKLLPARNAEVLSALVLLCTHLCEKADKTKELPSTFALCIGPAIAGYAFADRAHHLTDMINTAILYGDVIFGHSPSPSMAKSGWKGGDIELPKIVPETTPVMELKATDIDVDSFRPTKAPVDSSQAPAQSLEVEDNKEVLQNEIVSTESNVGVDTLMDETDIAPSAFVADGTHRDIPSNKLDANDALDASTREKLIEEFGLEESMLSEESVNITTDKTEADESIELKPAPFTNNAVEETSAPSLDQSPVFTTPIDRKTIADAEPPLHNINPLINDSNAVSNNPSLHPTDTEELDKDLNGVVDSMSGASSITETKSIVSENNQVDTEFSTTPRSNIKLLQLSTTPMSPTKALNRELAELREYNSDLEKDLIMTEKRYSAVLQESQKLQLRLQESQSQHSDIEEKLKSLQRLHFNEKREMDLTIRETKNHQSNLLDKALQERDDAIRELESMKRKITERAAEHHAKNQKLRKEMEEVELKRVGLEQKLEKANQERYETQYLLEKSRRELEKELLARQNMMELLEESKVKSKEGEYAQTVNQETSALKAAEERLEDLRCRLLYLKEKRQESEQSLRIEKSKAVALNDKVMRMEQNAAKMRREKIELQRNIREARHKLQSITQHVSMVQAENDALMHRIRTSREEHEFEMKVLHATIAEHSETLCQLQPQPQQEDVGVNGRQSSVQGLEERLDAIKKRVEQRLLASKDSLSSIEYRAETALHQTHARLETIGIQISQLSANDALQ